MKLSTKDNCFLSTGEHGIHIEGKGSLPLFRLTSADFLNGDSSNMILRVAEDKWRSESAPPQDNLIIEVAKNGDGNTTVQTGNYIGQIWRDKLEINITSRFGAPFLKRMLNYANDIYLDDVDAVGERSKDIEFTRYILFYLFTQSLEKAFLLGLPRIYQNINYHDLKLHGRLNIKQFIMRDIPFLGKVSSVSRELQEDQAILDVLHKAVSIIERTVGKTNRADATSFTGNISHIKPRLREMASRKPVDSACVKNALNSKALLNPIFFPYKAVLRYAEYILKFDSIKPSENNNGDGNCGFLVNVAELFEIYVTKLLANHFGDWEVTSPKIGLYDGLFYSRKIIPDIVMRKGNDILVFDTKYKRMNFQGLGRNGMGDLDRTDFFQINTYMSYYQQQRHNLICGGLLYPLSKEIDTRECYSPDWLGNISTQFIVDGLEIGDGENVGSNNIALAEDRFLRRIEMVTAKTARASS